MKGIKEDSIYLQAQKNTASKQSHIHILANTKTHMKCVICNPLTQDWWYDRHKWADDG